MVNNNSTTINNVSNNDDDHNNYHQLQQQQQIDQYTYINNILDKGNCTNGGDCNDDGDINKYLESLNDTEKYLLGATALDCSIMLAFQRLPNNYYEEIER